MLGIVIASLNWDYRKLCLRCLRRYHDIREAENCKKNYEQVKNKLGTDYEWLRGLCSVVIQERLLPRVHLKILQCYVTCCYISVSKVVGRDSHWNSRRWVKAKQQIPLGRVLCQTPELGRVGVHKNINYSSSYIRSFPVVIHNSFWALQKLKHV